MAAASTYMSILNSLVSSADTLPNLPWHQSSDRRLAAVQRVVQPSRGDSVHRTLTRLRPGAGSPGGQGVDLKHNAYARYLNRKKGCILQDQCPENKSGA